MDRLANKVAMITGAGSGVGRACKALFASEGARVLGSRDEASYCNGSILVIDGGTTAR
jgi:NAD(P)-dependent dehydrogenase (short-subunit alcohol dehydrogenase family)